MPYGTTGASRRPRSSDDRMASYRAIMLSLWRKSDDPRCDEGHRGVGEMSQQRFEPAAPRHYIGVQERDEVGGAGREPGVSGGGGPFGLGMPDHLDLTARALEVGLPHRDR